MEYDVTQLNNGMRVVTCPMPEMESASIGIWISVGGRYEAKPLQGISHFIEHLMFKGSKNRSASKISRIIEGVGGQLNAYTSEEYTCYFVKVPGSHQELALDVLCDMVSNPLFNKQDMEKERSVIKEELNMILDHPAHYVHEIMHGMLWPENPLGRMLVGTKKSLNEINRNDILGFTKKNYFPSNMLICAAGNIDKNSVLKMVQSYFGKGKNKKGLEYKPFKAKQKKEIFNIAQRPINQVHVCMGMRTVERGNSDKYGVRLMSTILGGNMSSRLFQTIREKHGLAYDISSSTSFYRDTGGMVISAGIKQDKLKKFIDLVLFELDKVRSKGVKKSELEHAKEFYRGQLAMGFEKTMTRMLWLGENVLTMKKKPSMKGIYDSISAVTVDDVKRIAQKIFVGKNLNVAVIGPKKEEIKMKL